MITGRSAIKDAYRDDGVARSYIEERFLQPLGALLHDRQTQFLRRLILANSPKHALEIAPGPGRVTTAAVPLLGRGLTIADASAAMLKQARQNLHRTHAPQPHMVQADAFALPFHGAFDLVYTFRLLRHFEPRDRARLYAEVARLLRPGGLLLFDAVNETVSAPLRARAQPGEYRHYDALLRPESLRAELTDAGFEAITLTGVQHRYSLLTQLQILVAPRSRRLARAAMEVVDRLGGGEPLEWIVLCRRA